MATIRRTFTDQELSFLAAIHADPTDDTSRLVYADWLDENEQPEQAEFIRLQCRNACGMMDWWKYEYTAREKVLVKKHGSKWRGERASKNGCMSSGLWFKGVHRGLPAIEAIHWNSENSVREADEQLRRVAPHFQLCVTISMHRGILSDQSRRALMLSHQIIKRAQIVTLSASAGPGERMPLPLDFVEAAVSALSGRRLASLRLWGASEECRRMVQDKLLPSVPVCFLGAG